MGIVTVFAAAVVLVALLTREKPTSKPPAKAGEQESVKVDPFEQLAVLITPQELAVKARGKKKGPDPYIPATSYSKRQEQQIIARAQALQGQTKACFNKFIRDYQDKLYKHCVENKLGGENEEGCRKTAYQYSIHTRVVEEALKNCGIKMTKLFH